MNFDHQHGKQKENLSHRVVKLMAVKLERKSHFCRELKIKSMDVAIS